MAEFHGGYMLRFTSRRLLCLAPLGGPLQGRRGI